MNIPSMSRTLHRPPDPRMSMSMSRRAVVPCMDMCGVRSANGPAIQRSSDPAIHRPAIQRSSDPSSSDPAIQRPAIQRSSDPAIQRSSADHHAHMYTHNTAYILMHMPPSPSHAIPCTPIPYHSMHPHTIPCASSPRRQAFSALHDRKFLLHPEFVGQGGVGPRGYTTASFR